jgi:hypothetical protein
MVTCITYGWLVEYGVHLSAPLIMQFFSKLFSLTLLFIDFELTKFVAHATVGLTVTSMFNMAQTLMVDLYPGQGASATAANNLYRCLAGAGILAFIDPLINRMGVGRFDRLWLILLLRKLTTPRSFYVGWAFTFLSLLNACFLPLPWLEMKYGMQWRRERALRLQAKKEHLEEKKRVKLEEKRANGV